MVLYIHNACIKLGIKLGAFIYQAYEYAEEKLTADKFFDLCDLYEYDNCASEVMFNYAIDILSNVTHPIPKEEKGDSKKKR